jgi:5'-3' exonuclease
MDADLIFLSMSCWRSNIHLIREKIEFKGKIEIKEQEDKINNVEKDMLYVSIKETKDAYNTEMRNILFNESKYNISKNMMIELDKINFSNDLIFLCFLLGNDFLPHFPSIDIHTGGLDELIKSYIKVLLRLCTSLILVNNRKVTIDTSFFQMICEDMGNKEQYFFYNTLYTAGEKNKRRICREHDKYKKELWELENLKKDEQPDCLQLGIGDEDIWKHRYYEYYFKVSSNQEAIIHKLSQNYIEGIKWMTEYYFDTCPDWRWNYVPSYAPFISDIGSYIKSQNIDFNKIQFDNRKCIPMMSQLVSVLPPSCNYLLPNSYRYLTTTFKSPIIDMFPSHIKIDTLYKNQLWQCVPRMPYLDIDRVLEATKNLLLDDNEKERSVIRESPSASSLRERVHYAQCCAQVPEG